MSPEFLIRNWALVAAIVVGFPAVLFVLRKWWRRTPRARLAATGRRLKLQIREFERAKDSLRTRTKEFEMLQSRADTVSPRRLQKAEEAVEDARAMAKIQYDKLLVAENRVREIILQEFPPRQHESLRPRYLRSDEERGKPYTG
jgi:hypothetical protein